ncbi:hypothetical protein N7474_006634 [Penicillium riverlandense]|uniref:uncharacterized protein n=1 Tax=Penicillium riverlandense TaxID=1903569 RepID=UPI002547BC5A|nr:uncharacterized protein N7474_006634 [Penicillium riverlandense]KAJ5814857.1 hypothetical protein N7474_006634 [Penicillium riverlandense]
MLGCYSFLRGFWTSSSANLKWIPGPQGKAFKGNAQELQTNGAASCTAWFSLYKRYGPAYEMTIPFFRMHIINHPIYLEHIQKHNSKNYVRGSFIRNAFGPLHRTGIFIVDGNEWQFQRKSATRAFSKRNFENHITKSLHQSLDILTGLLANLAKEQTEFDFQELMGRFMFCLFLRVAFHEDKLAREILSEDPESLRSVPDYIAAFDKAALCESITEKLSGEDKITKRATNLFYSKIDDIINKRLDAMRNGYTPDPDGGVDLLDLFAQSTTDPYKLGGMVFSFLSAGREWLQLPSLSLSHPLKALRHTGDTTAYSLTWLMKEIYHKDNQHLDAANKIRAEAEELGLTNGYLNYGDAPKLRFANAMWDETARLDTVSPAGQMEAAEDDILPAVPELKLPPRHVKKGDVVSYQNYVLSRMPEVWGEDASVFNPYRWFKENGESVSYSPFSTKPLIFEVALLVSSLLMLWHVEYHSWNAGPRSCLGRALATYEGIAVSTAILQRFDVILTDDSKTYEPLAALNMV